MNLSRCEHGHFYDKEKYPTCPHCAGGSASDDSLTTVFTEGEATETANQQMVTMPLEQPSPIQSGGLPIAPAAPAGGMGFPVAGLAVDEPTMPLGQGGPTEPLPMPSPAPMPLTDISPMPTPQRQIPMPVSIPTPPPVQMPPEIKTNPMPVNQMSSDDDDDHTVGFFDFDDEFFSTPSAPKAAPAPAQNIGPTSPVAGMPQMAPVRPVQAKPAPARPGEPCVGWLVALSGSHLGTDYRLKIGKNFIGRSSQMDVALTDDKSVSRDKHAIVVYEPKQHLYLVQPGEASTLVYRNEQVVLSPVQLEAYDVITVGDVNLLFMPLCNKE